MIRALLLIAALIVSVAPAWAQSDLRKLAIFYQNGTNVNPYTTRPTGNTDASNIEMSQTNHIVLTALDRMGVPYTIFDIQDSTGGWAKTMRATRPAGTADSTWFRQNGYFGWLTVARFYTGSQSTEIFRHFTDAGSNRGVQTGSPLDGRWGIPGLVLCEQPVNNSGLAYTNGAHAFRSEAAGTNQKRSFGVSGDSLAAITYSLSLSPAQASDVTILIATGDSLTSATGMAAWRYRTSTYYYTLGAYTNPTMTLLGLAQLFDAAGYKPRRKLNLHLTLDHVFPDQSIRTAPSDSFFKYVDFNKLRFSGAIEAYSVEYAGVPAATAALWKARKASWPAHPHSHNVAAQSWFTGGSTWDLTAFSDTAAKRQKFNFMERAISDTIGLSVAKGYERTLSFPGDGIWYPDVYIATENRYTDMRVGASDSTGHTESYYSGRKVNSARRVTAPQELYALPFYYIDPKSGRGIFVHDAVQFPGFSDTLWGSINATGANTLEGKVAVWNACLANAMVFDSDVYFHPDANFSGPDQFMDVFMRRTTYLLGRLKNIVEVSPSYRPRTPRRSNNAVQAVD